MSATTVAAGGPVREEAGLATAYRLLWLAVIFDFLAFGVGFEWDKRWHATHAFEDFFSPPHLFIYTMHLCATITLAYIAFNADLRRWFGATFRLPLVPFPIPGAIGLAGAGFGVVALAGMFDAIWHTSFGLDETNWSFPHSRLGWGLFAAIGFAFTTAAIWVGSPGGPLVGVLLFIAGSLLADRIWSVVAVPTRGGVLGLATLAGIVMPALTGIVDLSLRARIP